MNFAEIVEAIANAASELEIDMLDIGDNAKLRDLADARIKYLVDGDESAWLAAELAFGNSDEEVAVSKATIPAPAPAQAAPAPAKRRVYAMHETVDMDEFIHVKVNNKGHVTGVHSTIENVQRLFELYDISCRYNGMTKRVDIRLPGIDHKTDNADNTALAEVKSLCRRIGVPVTEVQEYVSAIADRGVYHPVVEWLDGVKWDGKSRLQDLFDTLQVAKGQEAYRDTMIRRWLISAIAALYSAKDDDKFELVLVFTGAQGLGKTSWVKALCPVENAVKEGVALNPDEKDSVLQAMKHWLIELGELDGIFRKADIAKLKSFMSHTYDEVRLPYAKMDSRFKRRTVAFGSVNENQYLTDTTGNRRWLTVAVLGVNYQHRIDMQQLWAEVRELYRAGEQWHLTKAEDQMLSSMNKQHEAIQPMEEMLAAAFTLPSNLTLVGVEQSTPAKSANSVKLNASMVLRGLNLPVDKKNANEMATALRKLVGPSRPSGKLGNYWELTPKRPEQWSALAA